MMTTISEPWAASVRSGLSPDSPVNQFLEDARCQDAATLLARSGVSLPLMKQLVECMLYAELEHHRLGNNQQGETKPGNYRNGSTPKTVATPLGALTLAVPRTRFSTFVPRLIPRYQRSLSGFDNNILALYAKGLPRDVLHAQLLRLYGAQAWAELGAILTKEVLHFTAKWQRRALAPSCAAVHFGTLETQWPQDDTTAIASVLFALGISEEGNREVFGFWDDRTADGDFLCEVLLELRERGLAAPGMISGSRTGALAEAALQVYPTAAFRCLRADLGLAMRDDKVFA
jgi:putative transposase